MQVLYMQQEQLGLNSVYSCDGRFELTYSILERLSWHLLQVFQRKRLPSLQKGQITSLLGYTSVAQRYIV